MTFRIGMFRDLGRYALLVWQSSKSLTIATLILRVLRSILPLALLYVAKLIIDDVVTATKTTQTVATGSWAISSVSSSDLRNILFLLGLEFGLALLADILGRITSFVDGLLSEKLSNDATLKLMRHSAKLDLKDFENSDFQDQLDRARHQTSANMTLMVQILNQAQDLLTVVSFALGLIYYVPWMIVFLIISLVPGFLGEAHFNALGYDFNYKRTPQRREMDYLRNTSSTVDTAKELKIFGLYDFLAERYFKVASSLYTAHRQLALRRATWGSLSSGIGTAGYYLAYAYIIWRTLSGGFTVGDLTFMAASLQRLRGLLEGVLAGFSSITGQALYLTDLFSFFDLRPSIVSPRNPRPFPQRIVSGFEFQNVAFKYPGTKGWTFRNFNLKINAGEVVCLVGENGAGKTTLVKLLARLYDPEEGRILLDGHDIREYSLEDYRKNVGVIFQDFVHYNFSAGDNIAAGNIEARGDVSRIRAAARRSRASDFIQNLPRGYDQMIGKQFQNGVELSGGQWQRLAIARAYMREAELLILDEPTAALDARAEFEVFQRFKELSKGKTVVLISHRFSSVRMADRILVLADGKVEEDGNHRELVQKSGRYAELFELQAAGFR